RRGDDPNDRWEEWRVLEHRWDGRLTFFVASYNFFDEHGATYDVAYDIRRPEVASVFRALAAEGAEIGIHLSLQSRRSAQQVRSECERLEEALAVPVRSARHHWWALGERPVETLRAHQDAGIVVDCSFGFNDRPGFRRGIAVPFHAYDPEAEAPLRVWSLPTTAMDRAVVEQGRRAEESAAELERMWGIVASVGGALVLDWHADALNPRALPGSRGVLVDFVDRALADGATLKTPLEVVEQAAADARHRS